MEFAKNVFPHNSYLENDCVYVDGVSVKDIISKFGSPVMIYSKADIVNATNEFVEVFDRVFFATKAAPIVELERIICSLGTGCDVASVGELEVALVAKCVPKKIIVHGNAKSDELIRRSLEVGVLRIVIEDEDECDRIERIAKELAIDNVDVQLRLTPGIEAHTHEYLKTGAIDSKFGSAIEHGVALSMCERIVNSDILRLKGFHCHIGSQIFDTEPFVQAVRVIINFYAQTKKQNQHCGDKLVLTEVNVGGGFGIHYQSDDDPPSPIEMAKAVKQVASELCREHGFDDLEIWAEPGRALVGQAGITAYKVSSRKEIPGIRKYIAVDGGMSDNIRPALYGAKHLVFVDGKHTNENEIVSIAGMHCEEGDVLASDVSVSVDTQVGDIVLMASTGAYSWAMQSNYNMVRRPNVVIVGPDIDGGIKEIVRRETLDDLMSRMI